MLTHAAVNAVEQKRVSAFILQKAIAVIRRVVSFGISPMHLGEIRAVCELL